MEKYNNIKVLKGSEAVRKRPGMYIGSVDNKGLFSLFYHILKDMTFTKNSKVYIEYEKHSFIFKIENIDIDLKLESNYRPISNKYKLMYIYVATSLSYDSKLLLKSLENKIILEQRFKQGELLGDLTKKENYQVSHLELTFTLDREIWSKEFIVNSNYFLYKMQELALCYKGIIFEIIYPFQKFKQSAIFYYPNGLKDKTDIKVIDLHDKNHLSYYLDTYIEDIELEVSMVLFSNSVDKAYLKSYVNAEETVEHGSHVNAIIEGIILGIKAFLAKKGIATNYKITKEKLLSYTILIVQVCLKDPNYAGSVRNKLVNNDIIKPILTYVKEYTLNELKKDETNSIENLEIFHINW